MRFRLSCSLSCALLGYRWLYEQAGILHRDLSEGNIMFRRGSDGKVCGVLNDFDHAIPVGDADSKASRQRTGTAPYMAIDILEESPSPVHLYRHDLESLYYVLICVVCPRNHPDVQDWFSLGGRRMAVFKRVFFYRLALSPRSGFEVFSKWIKAIHRAFKLGLCAQSDHADGYQADPPYVGETLGGKVSFDIFSGIFDQTLIEEQPIANRE